MIRIFLVFEPAFFTYGCEPVSAKGRSYDKAYPLGLIPFFLALPTVSLAEQQIEEEIEEEGTAEELGREDMDEVLRVRGSAHSMSAALLRKRESLQIIDSIVAEDIGKLPNNNLVEAIQHVPGVQVGTRSSGETP